MAKIVVKDARFLRSYDRWKVDDALPPLPQACFAGRSNVGKSSLLNSLVGRRSLARISKTPGRTQLINLFQLTLGADGETREIHLVDLPGYGFAQAPESVRRGWVPMMEGYLKENPLLRLALHLLDIRHPPNEADIRFLDLLAEAEIPTLLVATKADKIGKTHRKRHLNILADALEVPVEDILPYSSETGEGRQELIQTIVEASDVPIPDPE